MTSRQAEQAELDVGGIAQPYQMQHHRSVSGDWVPMENGAAAHMWRPRATAVDAAAKCLAWTGFAGIPAMQVVDLNTGRVVWRLVSDFDRGAGPPIRLPDAAERAAHRQARAEVDERPPNPPDDDTDEAGDQQASLFDQETKP